MEAKETSPQTVFEDGCGRNYANGQVSDTGQNRLDVISRVSAVQNRSRGPRQKH